jgi:polysaccharide chain length determinant protein (PEP-CTERM system associated)
MLPGQTYTPEDVLRVGVRYKWLLIVPLVVVTGGTLVALRYVPDLYRSETLILVIPQRVPETYVRSTVTNRIEDRLNSISQQILSRTRLEAIIDELDLYAEDRKKLPMEDIVAHMRENIDADPVRGDAFRVSYVAKEPAVAQKVTERLASLFIEENLRDRSVLADGTSTFLDSQLDEARMRLVEHEKRLEAYRLRYAGELPSQAQSNLQALQTLQVQLQGVSDSLARDRDRRLLIQRQLDDAERRNAEAGAGSSAAAVSAVSDDSTEGQAAQQLANAKGQLEAMEMRLKPEHPDIIRAKRLIADLEVKAESERQAGLTSGHRARPQLSAAERRSAELKEELASVVKDIGGKEARLFELEADIARYRGHLTAIPTRESEMTELMRDYDTLYRVYTDLLAKRENSRVAANLERRQIGEQFRVLDPAQRPEVPFYPNRTRYTGMGALAGLGLGAGLVILLEMRDRSFRREEDIVMALRLPVLACIPRMYSRPERLLARRRLLSAGAAVVALVTVATAVAWRLLR